MSIRFKGFINYASYYEFGSQLAITFHTSQIW